MIHVTENSDLKEDLASLFMGFTKNTLLNKNTLHKIKAKLMDRFYDYQATMTHVKFEIIQTGSNDVSVCPLNFYTALLFNGIVAPPILLEGINCVMLDSKYPIYMSVGSIQGMPHD